MHTRSTLVLRLLLVVPLLAAGIALGRPDPARAATVCNNPDTFAFQNTTIKDSLVVPAGGSCNVTNVVIRGGVTVLTGAEFEASDSEIRGAVVAAAGPTILIVNHGVVRGSVTVVGATLLVGLTAEIRGDLTVTDGDTTRLFVERSAVRGSATISRNSISDNAFVVGNSIDGDLICEGNTQAPTIGIGIGDPPPPVVGGVATGQCAGLEAP